MDQTSQETCRETPPAGVAAVRPHQVTQDHPSSKQSRDPWSPENCRRGELTLHASMLVLSTAVVIAAAVLNLDPRGSVAPPGISFSLPPLCLFRRFFGIDCPGCGLTRCFVSAAHGDFSAALQFHPVGLLFFFLVLAQLPYRTIQIVRLMRGKATLELGVYGVAVAAVLGALMLGQWVFRLIA